MLASFPGLRLETVQATLAGLSRARASRCTEVLGRGGTWNGNWNNYLVPNDPKYIPISRGEQEEVVIVTVHDTHFPGSVKGYVIKFWFIEIQTMKELAMEVGVKHLNLVVVSVTHIQFVLSQDHPSRFFELSLHPSSLPTTLTTSPSGLI